MLQTSTNITQKYCQEMHYNYIKNSGFWSSSFTGKERDSETGFSYFGARYYDSDLMTGWLSVDPMADKYPGLSPYAYCAWNPVRLVDPDGEEWKDAEGNVIKDHSNIKVYIFYDPNDFDKQSRQMYRDAETKYGKGSVALSDVTTEVEFSKDWNDMSGFDIREVNLNYHGNNQTLMLDSKNGEYVTSTGNGMTNISGTQSINVKDLPKPNGNIKNAQLNINTCQSNNRTQFPLKGEKLTLMEAFFKYTAFNRVRGTDKGVSYFHLFAPPCPHPEDDSKWQYLTRNTYERKSVRVGLPSK